jgi:integrase/recombinase XerD
MKKQQTTANHNDNETRPVLWPQAGAYLDHLRDRGFKAKTQQTIRYALRHFCGFMAGRGRRKATEVDALDLEKYQLHLSAQTVGTQITYLFNVRCWFGWLEETQQLFLNPAASVRLPRRPPPRLNVPTEEQMLRLLAAPKLETPSGLRDRAWLETAYATGARRLEMTRLTLADVDLQRGVLRLYGKGDKERLVPLGQQAIGWLEKYLRQARPKLVKESKTAALWVSSRGGGPLCYQAMQQQLRGYAQRLGLPVPLLAAHNLRRACVTHLLQHGASPLLLKELLGHTRTATLTHYLRRSLADLKATHRRTRPGE